jgi:glucokinase
MGPGTGLGFCYLTKPKDGRYYEVQSAEAGHSDMSVVTEEDWRLHQHVIKYIKESDNVEAQRSGHTNITRVSVERVCAGPAVPLIYDFYRQQDRFKDHPLPLEKDKHFNDLTSKDIIN